VDAELRVGGRLVGVEITQSIWNARAHVEIGRLTRAVEVLVRAQHLQWPTGYVAVNARFRALPPARELRLAESVLAREIGEGIRTLELDPSARRETAIDTSVPFLRWLRLIQFPGGRSGFGWLTGSDEWGGYIDGEATAFIDHLLATKPAQTARYEEAWVVIVNRDGLVGPADVASALAERRGDVPTNWTRVWVLPATDEVSVALAWPAALR
jgi:hypothetical protein